MKKMLTYLIVIGFWTVKANAQLFQNTIGKDDVEEYGESIAQAADSSYLVAGDFAKAAGGETTPFIIRLKKDGSIQWSKRVNVPTQAIFTKVSYAEAVKTANAKPDGYIMLITEISYFYVVRLNKSGNVVWTRQFSGTDNLVPKIKPSYDNAGVLTGFIMLARNYYNPNYHGVILKIGTTGSTLWQKRITHNTTGTEYRFADIQATTDGGCIAAGNLYQNNKVSAPVLFRFSSIGTVLWRFSYIFTSGNETPPEIRGVAATFSGYAVTGSVDDGNITFSTTLSGTINWAFKYKNLSPPYQRVYGNSIVADASNNLVIACDGYSYPGPAAIIKLSSAGTVLFAKRFNNAAEFRDIKITKQGTYCAVGDARKGNDVDVFVLNITSFGTANSGCQPEAVTLTASLPFTKLLGAPPFGIVNETFINTAITATTTNVQTKQSLCGSNSLDASDISETGSDKLMVANDMTSQRVMVKWQTLQTDNNAYEAVLYNNAGLPVHTVILRANQPAFISMQSMHAGIYSVILKQKGMPIAKEKVVWFK